MNRKDLDSSEEESKYAIKEDQQKTHSDNQNLLNMSNFQTQVIQKYNPYTQVSVSGPKWSKEGG